MSQIKILKFRDQNYPYLLKQIHQPPQEFFYQGNPEILNKTCIAIVGTRKYSNYGEEITRKIVSELSHLDICIVSGLALGIDSIAHRAALDFDLPTIAVLGNGMDEIYPPANEELAKEIIEKGLIISEYPVGTPPTKFNFPQRNRIVSGLSVATILIEAPAKSGALITTKLAVEQNREVFVIPGDIDRENGLGPLKLLQDGAAYPVSSGQEIIDVLKAQPLFSAEEKPAKVATKVIPSTKLKFLQKRDRKPKSAPIVHENILYNLSSDQQKILACFQKHHGLDFENLFAKSNLPLRELLVNLSLLEVQKLVITKSGKYYRSC